MQRGEQGEIRLTPQYRDGDGKWKEHPSGRGKGVERWRARAYVRGRDGVVRELSCVGSTKPEALVRLERKRTEQDRGTDAPLKPSTPVKVAGEVWLERVDRPDSGLSERTKLDYRRTFERYVSAPGSSVRGLTLEEVNDPQTLRSFLERVADTKGTGAAKITRTVLSGVLDLAVSSRVLPYNAMGTVSRVAAKDPKATERDTRRSFTKAERAKVLAYADERAAEEALDPRTQRKRDVTADLVAFMAGTGVRVSEARALRWEHVDLDRSIADIPGTKSKAALRRVPLPAWLAERLRERADRLGVSEGYVFASPGLLEGEAHETPWEQSNCAGALAGVIKGAGMTWATPHAFRRTVATLLHEAGVPLVKIADQLGHANPSMTASVYLGRDLMGARSEVAQHLWAYTMGNRTGN